MGLSDLFSWDIRCPQCGRQGARKSLFGGVKCPNRGCENFDMGLFLAREETGGGERATTLRNPRTGQPINRRARTGFDPESYTLEVSYRNFRGEEKTFVGDRRTLRRKRKHVSLRVAPTGARIALALDRIRNLAEVEAALRRCDPTARERRVMTFHARRGSSSPLYEKLRAKYPEWILREE